jgi:hypothetical protein
MTQLIKTLVLQRFFSATKNKSMVFPKLPVVDPSTIKYGDMIDLDTEDYYTEEYVDNTLNGLLCTVQSKFDKYSEDS